MSHKLKFFILIVLYFFSQSVFASDVLSECTYKLTGFKFAPVNSEEYLMVNSDLNIYFEYSENPLNIYSENAVISGKLSGPGIADAVEITAPIGDILKIDRQFFKTKGDYIFSNIYIKDGNNKIYSYPSVVVIHVIEKILSTSVNTSLLSLEEMNALGIVTDVSNYTGYNVSISLGFESGVETLSIPVILNNLTYEDVDGEQVYESGSALVERIKFPATPSGSCSGGTGLLKPPPEEGDGAGGNSIPAIVYFPGNVGFLHNFFKSVLIVINTTPTDANISVDSLNAKAILPKGSDGNYGTPENPGDDPLRIALTEEGREQIKQIINLGPDGKLGTEDDTSVLNAGDTGIAFFLLEGLQEGKHTVQFDFNGKMHINGSDTEINGSASGVILVKNPDLSVQFTHPDTVRANMPYDMTVTVKNTSTVPANKTYIQFDNNSMVGGLFLDENDNPVGDVLKAEVLNIDGGETLNPGETGIVKLRVMPLVTGKVVASYLHTESGTVSLSLIHGVDDRGVGLSPDTVKMSWHFYTLPEDYKTALDLVVGDALSVATDPALPDDVIRILGRGSDDEADEVQQLANYMMFAGMYYNLGEDISNIVFRNILNFRTVSSGVEQLIRTSYAGQQLKAVEQNYLNSMLSQGDSVFFENFLKAICDKEGYRVILLNNVKDVELTEIETKLIANADENNIQGTIFFTLNNKTLILLPKEGNRAFTIRSQALNSSASIYCGLFNKITKYQGEGISENTPFKININGHVTVKVDKDNNGSFESILEGVTSNIQFPSLDVIKVKQLDPEYFPENRSLNLKYSDTLLVLFNRRVNKEQAENKLNYSVELNKIIDVNLQTGGRACILRLQKPVGHFFERNLNFGSIFDIYNEYSVLDVSVAIDMSENLLGYMVEGTVFNSDGEPLSDNHISISACLGKDDFRTFCFKTDENGHYLIEQVNLPAVSYFKVRNGNKMRRPVVSGRFVGQRIVKDIYFTGTGDVSVTVFDEFGNVMSDVSLSLNHHTEMYHRTATTDNSGHALFKKVHMGSFTVHAVKQITGSNQIEKVWTGLAGGKLIKKGSTLEMELYLESRRGTIKGKVLEETIDENGNAVYIPIVHQAVVVYANFENTGGGYQCYNCENGMNFLINGQTYVPVAWQYTDSQGEFNIENIPTGKIFLEISTDLSSYTGTGKNNPFLLKKDETLNVTLVKKGKSAAVIYGQITYFDGSVAAATKVSINGRGESFYNYTDSEGRFRFENLSPGTWTLNAKMGKSYSATTSIDILSSNEEVECNLKFDAVGRIEGKLFAPDGLTPLAGYMVVIPPYEKDKVLYDPYTGAAIPVEQRTCFTDNNGSYHFENLGLGTYDIVCVNGLRVANTTVSILEPGETAVANMSFLPAGKVKGKVVQSDGVTGVVARVSLKCNVPSKVKSTFGKITYGFLGEIITDSSGKFEFPVVNAGKINIFAKNFFASENSSFEAFLKEEGEEIEVTLRLGEQYKGRIGGRIFLPDGVSIAGENVDVVITGDRFPSISLKTDSKSEFVTAPILPSGTYTIEVTEKVTGYRAKERVFLSKDSSVFKDIRLKGFGKVEVKITQPDNTPVTEGVLRLTTNGCDGQNRLQTVMFNNDEGKVTLDRICEGNFAVSVISADGLAGRTAGKISRNGQKVTLTVVVEGYGNVIGKVFEPDGVTPLNDVELTLYSQKTGKAVAYGSTYGTDEDSGSYNFPYLPFGDYVLVCFDVVNGRFGQGYFSIKEHNKTEIANITLTGSGTVKGKVLNTDGSPASNIQITIEAEAKIFSNNTEIRNFTKVKLTSTTSTNGDFKFENIPITSFKLFAREDETGVSGFASGEVKENGEIVNCNVHLTASGAVKVKVTDYYGNAYQYAVVKLTRYPFESVEGEQELTMTATTDGRGSAKFLTVPSGYLTVTARDTKGFKIGEQKVQLKNQGEEIEVVLQSPGRNKIFGQVYYADGSVVENGTVYLLGDGVAKRTVIVNGNYLFENIIFGNYVVKAESGIQKKEVEINLNEDLLSGNVNIFLNPTGTVSGVLLTASGEPVVANPVVLFTNRSYFGMAVTDNEGKFSFALVPFGDVSLSAYNVSSGKRGVASGTVDEINSDIVVTITLESLGTLKGKVVGKGGTDFFVPGMRVTYRNTDNSYRKTVNVTGDGKFRIDNVPIGNYTLTYGDEYGFTAKYTGELIQDNQVIDNHIFLIENYKKITGILKNVDGSFAYNCDIKLSGKQYRSVRTDRNGLFELDYVIDGNYIIKAFDTEKIHVISRQLDTSVSQDDVINLELTFGDNVKLRGYVFKENQRVVGAKVTEINTGISTYTNAEGEYILAIPRLESGVYTVKARTATRIPLYGQITNSVSVAENVDGAVINMPDIEVEQTASLTGKFRVIGTSTPISGVRVEVECRQSSVTVFSINDGTFLINNIPVSEPVSVNITYGGYYGYRKTIENIVLSDNYSLGVIEIDTTPPSVTLTNPSENSEFAIPGDFEITVTDSETSVNFSKSIIKVNHTNITDRFNFSGDKAIYNVTSLNHPFKFGDNLLVVWFYNSQNLCAVKEMHFTISEAPTSVLGVVLKVDGSVAGEGISLTCTNTDTGQEFTTVTDATGNFKFENTGIGHLFIESYNEDIKECIRYNCEVTNTNLEIEAELRFYKYGILSGTVFKPLKENEVEYTHIDENDKAVITLQADVYGTRNVFEAETDFEGKFQLKYIPLGSWNVIAYEKNGNHVSEVNNVELLESEREKIADFHYLPIGKIKGNVYSYEGEKVVFGTVSYSVVNSNIPEYGVLSEYYIKKGSTDISDSDFGYVFENVISGTVKLEAQADKLKGFFETTIDFEGQEKTVDITLGPNRTVQGRVMLQDGTVPQNVEVALYSGSFLQKTVKADSEGKFHFEYLQDKTYYITATATYNQEDYFVKSEEFNFSSAVNVELPDLVLEKDKKPEINITSVTPDTNVYAGSFFKVSYQVSDDVRVDKVTLNVTGAFEKSSSNSVFRQSFSWYFNVNVPKDIDLTENNKVEITLTATDSSGQIVTTDKYYLTVVKDNTPPVITVLLPDNSPMSDGYHFALPPVNFSVNYVDGETGINSNLAVTYMKINGDIRGLYSSGTTIYYNYLTSPLVAGENTYEIAVTNKAGLTATYSGAFFVDFYYTLEGTVFKPDGNPVGAGYVVKLNRDNLETVTNSEGYYKFENLRHSLTYEITSDVPENYWYVENSAYIDKNTMTTVKDLHYFKYGTVNVKVNRKPKKDEDQNGSYLFKEGITLNLTGVTDRSKYISTGEWTFTHIPIGNYQLTGVVSTSPSAKTEEKVLELGGGTNVVDVKLHLPALNSVSGNILNSNGEIMSSRCKVTLIDNNSGRTVYDISTYSNFTINNIVEGNYKLLALYESKNLYSVNNTVFEVKYHGEQHIDLILEPAKSVLGQIFQDDGVTPAVNAKVKYQCNSNQATSYQYTYTDNEGKFVLNNVYNDAFNLQIRLEGFKTKTIFGDFETTNTVNVGSVALEKLVPPRVTVSIDRDSYCRGDSYNYFNIAIEGDSEIKKYGYTISGVLENSYEQNLYNAGFTVEKSGKFDVPSDCEYGEIKIIAYAIDSEGLRGESEPVVVNVVKAYRSLEGTVYRKDGVTPATNAKVKAFVTVTENGEMGQFDNTRKFETVTDENGYFLIENFIDVRYSDNFKEYNFRVYKVEDNVIELFEDASTLFPENDLNYNNIVLVETTPQQPELQVDCNTNIPVFADSDSIKPVIFNCNYKYEISAYGYEISGLFERNKEFEVMLDSSGGFNYKTFNKQKLPNNEYSYPIEIEPPRTLEELPETWGQSTIALKLYVIDEFERKLYVPDISLTVVPEKCDFTGKVEFEDGSPVYKAEVKLIEYISDPEYNVGGKRFFTDNRRTVFETITDSNGNFTLFGCYSIADYMREKIMMTYEMVPQGDIAVYDLELVKGNVFSFQLEISYFNNETTKRKIIQIDELPLGNYSFGNVTLSEDTPIVVVNKHPYSGFVVKNDGSLNVEMYVFSENDITSVTASFQINDITPCEPLLLTDNGVLEDFTYGGKTGFHKFTGTLTCDLSQFASQSILLNISVTDTQTNSYDKLIPLYLTWNSNAVSNGNLNLEYPSNLTEILNNSDSTVIPIHFGNNFVERRILQNILTEKENELVSTEVLDGYGEITHLKTHSSVYSTKVLVKSTVDTWGEGCMETFYSTLEFPKISADTVFLTASEFDNSVDYSLQKVVITEGELELTENKSFKQLTLSNNVTLKLTGDITVTCQQFFVALPESNIVNGNDLGEPKVTIKAPDIYIYGDYSSKGESISVIEFVGNKREH